MAEVSVITPNFNSGILLRRCIDSVLGQTFADWEMIIVDNNSHDESRKTIEELKDPRIRCVSINNGGVIAMSRNLGSSLANGKFLAFLDADDWWRKNKLEVVLNCFEKRRVNLVYHQLERSPKRIIRPRVGNRYPKSPGNLLCYGNRIPNSSVVVKRESFVSHGPFDEAQQLIAAEDFDLWERFHQAGLKFHFESRVLGFYHEAPGTANSDIRRVQSAVSLLEKHRMDTSPGWLQLAVLLAETQRSDLATAPPVMMGGMSKHFLRRSDRALFNFLLLRNKIRSRLS